MTEELNTETESTESQEEATPPQGEVEQDSTDWKSEARKWESRAKSNIEAADRWREYEQSLKSEDERRAERLVEVENELAEERAKSARLEVIAEKGLAADAVNLLTGKTREEIEAQAEALLKLVGDQSQPKTPRPVERQGKESGSTTSTAEEFARTLGSML